MCCYTPGHCCNCNVCFVSHGKHTLPYMMAAYTSWSRAPGLFSRLAYWASATDSTISLTIFSLSRTHRRRSRPSSSCLAPECFMTTLLRNASSEIWRRSLIIVPSTLQRPSKPVVVIKWLFRAGVCARLFSVGYFFRSSSKEIWVASVCVRPALRNWKKRSDINLVWHGGIVCTQSVRWRPLTSERTLQATRSD